MRIAALLKRIARDFDYYKIDGGGYCFVISYLFDSFCATAFIPSYRFCLYDYTEKLINILDKSEYSCIILLTL